MLLTSDEMGWCSASTSIMPAPILAPSDRHADFTLSRRQLGRLWRLAPKGGTKAERDSLAYELEAPRGYRHRMTNPVRRGEKLHNEAVHPLSIKLLAICENYEIARELVQSGDPKPDPNAIGAQSTSTTTVGKVGRQD